MSAVSDSFAPTFKLTDPTTVVILGAARSGLAAALFLKTKGFTVYLSDAGTISEETQAILKAEQIAFEHQGHSEAFLTQARFMVASPGIPLTAKPYVWAKQQGIPVVSEIELSWQFLQQMASPPRLIAVTGSNGKSTVVSLITALLAQAGYGVKACGNIGVSFIQCVAEHEQRPFDFLVLEISSFQLETTYTLKPHIAVLLNLYENHLDRHGEMEIYFALKSRLFRHQRVGDVAVLSQDNAWCQTLQRTLTAQSEGPECLGFSVDSRVQQHQLMYAKRSLMPLEAVCLQGQHNLENIAAVLTSMETLDIAPEVVKSTLQHFQGMPHRLEPVGQWQGRSFINDSKSTNYLAAEKALLSMTQPVVWIAGGQDKGGDFSALAQLVHEKVKHVVLMGACREIFAERLRESGYTHVSQVEGMAAAIDKALAYTVSGDVVLLSPATASYDAYANFEARGDDFRDHVAQLVSKV